MEISAEEYNSYRNQAKINAQYTIEQIKLKEGQRQFDLVLDIGSGFGNMTVLLAENVNFKKLIGLDIDDKMIEFAKQNYKKDNFDYIHCDVQLPWDQLSDEVKQLEGKCSLIFSNSVLHWIQDIKNCAENLSRFLAPGGRIYACMLPIDTLYQLSGEAKELETVIPLLKPGNFTQTWKSELNNSGLKIETADEFIKNWTVPKQLMEKFVSTVRPTLLLKHAVSEEARNVVEKYKDWILDNVYNDVVMDEHQKCRYDRKSLFIVAKKPEIV